MALDIKTTTGGRTHQVSLAWPALTDAELAELTAAIGRTSAAVFYDDYKSLNDRRDELGIEADWSV